jgi:hypothetical protein
MDEKDVEINKNKLDEEWEKQPTLYHKYCKDFSEQSYLKDCKLMERRKKQNELKLVESKLSMDIRTRPDKYGHTKLTENLIESIILLDEDRNFIVGCIEKINSEIMELDRVINEIDLAVKILFQKQKSLEGLTSLYLNEYYSGDIKMKDIREKFQEKLNNLDRR